MKKLILLILCCSCSKTLLLDKKDVTGIPGQSTAVIAEANMNSDSLFSTIAKSLAKSGWVVRSSREAMQISCDGKLSPGNIYIKPVIKVEEIKGGKSRAIFKGTWSLARMEQDKIDYVLASSLNTSKKIAWEGYKTKPGAAFQNLIILAKKVPNSKLSYSPN